MRNFSCFLTLIIFFSFSCNPCNDVNCLNGGICNKGVCSCPDAFEGPDCDIHKDPAFVTFNEIEVFNIPLLNPDGEPWDEDGTAADIVVVMTGKIGDFDLQHYLSPIKENVTSNSVTLIRSGTITITDRDYVTHRTIGVYDKEDSGEDLELIYAYEWNIDSVAQATGYSPSLLFSEPCCPGIRFEVKYDYVD